ncbi:MAG: amidohydrolase family protein [Myxococcales bacterium]|nr:amidohydrolase family protein [Myxococcales bacterium]
MSEASENTASGERLRKTFPVFDCDAHINDPLEIWTEYVAEADREAVKGFYWQDESQTLLNGRTLVMGGATHHFRPMFNPIHMAGPQMTKPIIRKLLMDVVMGKLSEEQVAQIEHAGAVDGYARCRDMDLMGIDQVMVIPTMMVMHVPFGENPEGARGFARAYNDWAVDYCAAAPDRLFPAAWLPLQSPAYTVEEIRRTAEKGFRMGLVRPIDARHQYPNQIGRGIGGATFDLIYKEMEACDMVLGMHTFPAPDVASYHDGRSLDYVVSPGELNTLASDPAVGQRIDAQALSFVFEAQAWLIQVLLSGFLDRYPKLRMAVLESNASWVPSVLAHCDRLFKLHAKERRTPASRLPSEAFAEQCTISFEGDEAPAFKQWRFFQNTGVWASDAYHTDGADVWTAIREMNACGVPERVQARMLGANASDLYRIEQKTFVSEEAPPLKRPDWFPQGELLERFTELSKDPRKNGAALQELLGGGSAGQTSGGSGSGY